MTGIYYIIAKVDKRNPKETHSSNWPKILAYSFDLKKILITEGYGHGLMGGTISLSNFNTLDWSDFFQETNSEWFSDYISDNTILNLTEERSLVNLLKKNGCAIKKTNY